ncbi:hypothetical protein AB6C99_11335 [Vibrio cyclitrophicus]
MKNLLITCLVLTSLSAVASEPHNTVGAASVDTFCYNNGVYDIGSQRNLKKELYGRVYDSLSIKKQKGAEAYIERNSNYAEYDTAMAYRFCKKVGIKLGWYQQTINGKLSAPWNTPEQAAKKAQARIEYFNYKHTEKARRQAEADELKERDTEIAGEIDSNKARRSKLKGEISKITTFLNLKKPELSSVNVTQKMDDGNFVAWSSSHNKQIVIIDMHNTFKQAGYYNVELVIDPSGATYSRKLPNGFEETINVYLVTTEGYDEYERWLMTEGHSKLKELEAKQAEHDELYSEYKKLAAEKSHNYSARSDILNAPYKNFTE